MPERQYSESEVRRIIEAAAERQRGGAAAGSGLTLAEIERAGHEAGIDAVHLRAAARALDTVGSVEDDGRDIVVRRLLLHPLSDANWNVLTAELEDRFRSDAHVSRALRAAMPAPPPRSGVREWQDRPLDPRTSVRMLTTSTGTQLVVRHRVGWTAPGGDWMVVGSGVAGLVVLMTLVALRGAIEPPWDVVGASAVALLAFVVATEVVIRRDRRIRSREAARLSKLVDNVALQSIAPSESGQVDPVLLDDERGGAEGERVRRRVQ